MATFTEILYDVVFSPAKAMRDIAEGKKIRQAVFVFCLSLFLPAFAFHEFVSMNKAASVPVSLLLPVLGGFLLWFACSAVLALTAELLGGKGTATGLFTALGFIHIPKLFAIPLWLFSYGFPSIRPLFLGLGCFSLFIWTIYLEIAAIKGAYQVSAAKALLILLLPLAAGALLVILFFLLLGAAAMESLSRLNL